MVISRVTKVSNPRRSSRRRNPRKMSLKQRAIFGTSRQRAAAKAALKRRRTNPKRRVTVRHKRRVTAANPRRRRVRAAKANPRRRRRKSSNPAHLITLGLVNPGHTRARKRRRKNVARKAKANYRRRRRASSNPRRRRRNAVRLYTRRAKVYSNPRRRRRYANPHRRRRRMNVRRHHHRSRRNPTIFGHSVGLAEAAAAVGAGLVGVWATKFVVNMIPANILPSTPVTGAFLSAAVAIGLGAIATMAFKTNPLVAYSFGFGGLMQAGSVLAGSVGLGQFGLSGYRPNMGDIVPGRFPIPMNPILAGQPVALPAPAPVPAGAGAPAHAAAMSGMGSIYNPYGRVF